MVECGGLENRFGGDSSDEGSNPSPSVLLCVGTCERRDRFTNADDHGPLRSMGIAGRRTANQRRRR